MWPALEDKIRQDWSGKTVLIAGFGVDAGESAVEFFLTHGAHVRVFDEKPEHHWATERLAGFRQRGVEFYFGGTFDIAGVDALIRSPGIRWQAPIIQAAQKQGLTITSATKLFFEYAPREHVIGVTGTKGKGTTSSLIKRMLEADGRSVVLGGNIGVPMLSLLQDLTLETWAVLELSSFQLIDLDKSPALAVILMVTSEHLDWHETQEDYVDAKAHLVRYQEVEDALIYSMDYKNSERIANQSPARAFAVSRSQQVAQGCCLEGDDIVWMERGKKRKLFSLQDVRLPGRHNLENICAATAAAVLSGISDEVIAQTVRTFTGLEHRLEFVAEKRGMRFYNDSFATTPESTIAAIESFTEPEILILGGSTKNSDFRLLGKLIVQHKNHLRGIVGIGIEWSKIKQAIIDAGGQDILFEEGCTTMSEIMTSVLKIGHPDDIVLLSPACASFGMFKDYKDRGQQFKVAVTNLV